MEPSVSSTTTRPIARSTTELTPATLDAICAAIEKAYERSPMPKVKHPTTIEERLSLLLRRLSDLEEAHEEVRNTYRDVLGKTDGAIRPVVGLASNVCDQFALTAGVINEMLDEKDLAEYKLPYSRALALKRHLQDEDAQVIADSKWETVGDYERIRVIARMLGISTAENQGSAELSNEIQRVVVRLRNSLSHFIEDEKENCGDSIESLLEAVEKRWNEREVNTVTLAKGVQMVKNGLDSYARTLSLAYTDPKEIIAAVDTTLRSFIGLSHKIDVACARLNIGAINTEKIDALIAKAGATESWRSECERKRRIAKRQKRRVEIYKRYYKHAEEEIESLEEQVTAARNYSHILMDNALYESD